MTTRAMISPSTILPAERSPVCSTSMPGLSGPTPAPSAGGVSPSNATPEVSSVASRARRASWGSGVCGVAMAGSSRLSGTGARRWPSR